MIAQTVSRHPHLQSPHHGLVRVGVQLHHLHTCRAVQWRMTHAVCVRVRVLAWWCCCALMRGLGGMDASRVSDHLARRAVPCRAAVCRAKNLFWPQTVTSFTRSSDEKEGGVLGRLRLQAVCSSSGATRAVPRARLYSA